MGILGYHALYNIVIDELEITTIVGGKCIAIFPHDSNNTISANND